MLDNYKIKRWWIWSLITLPVISIFLDQLRTGSLWEEDLVFALFDGLYPLWGSLLIGTGLGLLISLIPVKGLTYGKRLIRAIVIGILVTDVLFVFVYIGLYVA